nr:hypothetical protein [Trichoderma harzianum]
MDPFNGATSVRTIWEFAHNVSKLGKIVKCAPETWQQYSDGLRIVACLQTAIESTLKAYPQIRDLTIENNGQQCPLVEYINDRLGTVQNDASTLLKHYQALRKKRSKRRRIWDFISTNEAVVRFALNEKRISDLIKGVEQAQAHLHLALSLVSVCSTESLGSEVVGLLKAIKNEMVKHGQTIDEMKCDASRSELTKLGLEFDQKAKAHGRLKSTKPKRTNRDSGYGGGEDNDGHDADHECADDDEGSDQSTAEDKTQQMQVGDTEDTQFGFIYDKEAKQLFQVPIDSPEYEQAASPPANLTFSVENSRDSPEVTQTIIRADEYADSLSEDEWQLFQFRPIEELMEAITSADCTAYPTDAETNTLMDHASEIQLHFRPRSYVFIPETVELRFCKGNKSSILSFCVERISVTDTTQSFCVFQPCSALGNAQCKHVTIDIQAVAIDIMPCPIELVSCHCMIPGLNDGSNKQSDTILMMSKCCHSSRRRHTVVDITGHRQKKCAYKHMILGLVAEVASAEEDSDAATERAPSEAGNYDAPDVNHYPTEEDTISYLKQMVSSHHGEDDVILTLLNNVMLHDVKLHDVKSQIPAHVEWAVFVRFLQLSDKCSAALRDKAIKQAKTWVSNFHIPKTFDKDAAA